MKFNSSAIVLAATSLLPKHAEALQMLADVQVAVPPQHHTAAQTPTFKEQAELAFPICNSMEHFLSMRQWFRQGDRVSQLKNFSLSHFSVQ